MYRELSYDDAVNFINEVEAGAGESKIVVINLKVALKEGVKIKEYEGLDAEKIVERVESVSPEGIVDFANQPEARGGLGKTVAAAANTLNKGVSKLQPELETYSKVAGEELRKVVSKAETKTRNLHNLSLSKKNAGKTNGPMVMPQLSLPDQIAELDRILAGLDANIFNGDQLKLIIMEVKALRESIKKENVRQDGNLAAIRNQKLKLVEERLKIG
ncbi:MAG: hypothetical protein QXF01_01060 [Candidatus Micrarchaeaceae archaeon]